jgi:hypothetical protein
MSTWILLWLFIDDILVYSANHVEHEEQLKTVMEVLMEKKLFAKLKKCEFWLEECHSWVML